MKVFITGATGFVGRYVTKAVLQRGHQVSALVRSSTASLPEGVTAIEGDIRQPDSWKDRLSGMDAVIHLVGIIEEKPSEGITFDALHRQATFNVVSAAHEAGVKRFVHMSANGARENGVSGYQTSKWAAEEAVRHAGIPETVVLRPSLVFGQPGAGVPEFATQLVNDLIKPFPVWPVFGDGKYEMSPVHVEDVARAFALALESEEAVGQSLCLGGPEALPFTTLLERMAAGAGIRKKPAIHQPLFALKPMVSLLGGWLLPITSDQLNMLVEGNVCDGSRAVELFGLDNRPFTADNLTYLKD